MRPANLLFAILHRHSVLFGVSVGGLAMGLGVLVGTLPEAFLVGAVSLWLAWEARPHVLFQLGCYRSARRSARALARAAGPSLRGDVHRLTEAASLLAMSRVAEAKACLAQVEPSRLPPRGRFVHFLNLSALYCRLGDGEAALTMVEAAQAEAADLPAPWAALSEVNQAAALSEMGRFTEAVQALEECGVGELPRDAQAYHLNNLAWALALEGKDPGRSVELARRACELRSAGAGSRGTLGVAMLLAGAEASAALPHLRAALSDLERRGPHARAVILEMAAEAYRELGDRKLAASLDTRRLALPGGERGPALVAAVRARMALPPGEGAGS